jgi:hypothetical protein
MKNRFLKLFIPAALLIVIFIIMSKFPNAAEWYMVNIYPVLAIGVSWFSNLFPFSLSDILYSLLVIGVILLIILVIIKKVKFVKGLYILFYGIITVCALFYFLWGFSYFRQDFYTRCNVQPLTCDTATFKAFANEFIEKGNESYISAGNIDKQDIDKKIERQYEKLKPVLKIKYPNGRRCAKPMIYNHVMSKVGILGYFGIMNEIHVNHDATDLEYPFTLAHEKAHQFGIANEAECNLYAFLVCASSEDSLLRYSAYSKVIPYIMSDYRQQFPGEYADFFAKITPDIISDIKANNEHWTKLLSESLIIFQRKIYDIFLRTNNVSSGIKSYSEVVFYIMSVEKSADWVAYSNHLE